MQLVLISKKSENLFNLAMFFFKENLSLFLIYSRRRVVPFRRVKSNCVGMYVLYYYNTETACISRTYEVEGNRPVKSTSEVVGRIPTVTK